METPSHPSYIVISRWDAMRILGRTMAGIGIVMFGMGVIASKKEKEKLNEARG